MDGLVKANGGTVYDETKGIDYVKDKNIKVKLYRTEKELVHPLDL